MIAYKFFAAGARAQFSERKWPAPGTWIEAAPGPLVACRNGVHACQPSDLPYWISHELWQVELDREQIAGPQSIVARRGRLLEPIDAWNRDNARAFADACRARAERFVQELQAAPEVLDQGAQYLATAHSSYASGNYAVTAYASAMAFTLLAPSAAQAFRAERLAQADLLTKLLDL